MGNLLAYLKARPKATRATMSKSCEPREKSWINLGGQLLTSDDLRPGCWRHKSGRLGSWGEVHRAYDPFWEAYPLAKRHRDAFATLVELLGGEPLTAALWNAALDRAAQIQEYVAKQVFLSRKKPTPRSARSPFATQARGQPYWARRRATAS